MSFPVAASGSPPAPPALPVTPGGAPGEIGKFKLKPKAPSPVAAPGGTVPPVGVPAIGTPVPKTPPPFATVPPGRPPAVKPPPFPVVAPPKTGKTVPPIPHVNVNVEVPEEGSAAPVLPGNRRKKLMVRLGIGLAALLVVGAGAFYGINKFMTPAPPPPPPPVKAKAPVAAPTAATPAPATGTPGAGTTTPTPSDTLNKMAHVPANAINKAKDAVAARTASGQTRVDGGDPGETPATPEASPKTTVPSTVPSTGMRKLAPGLSATAEVDAAADASPAFRSFVANAKISGVFQGSPSRAHINGRIARAGEMIDTSLGIVFASVDAERRQLIFKDKSGAIVARRY